MRSKRSKWRSASHIPHKWNCSPRERLPVNDCSRGAQFSQTQQRNRSNAVALNGRTAESLSRAQSEARDLYLRLGTYREVAVSLGMPPTKINQAMLRQLASGMCDGVARLDPTACERIFLARRRLGWTQQRLADAADVSRWQVHLLERDSRRVSLRALMQVTAVLKMSIARSGASHK